MKTLHTGTLLTTYFETKRTRRAALARIMGIKTSTVLGYQKRESIQTKTLLEISIHLKHNFFMDIAMMLPPEYGSTKSVFEAKDNEIEALKEEVKKLTIQRDVLLQIR